MSERVFYSHNSRNNVIAFLALALIVLVAWGIWLTNSYASLARTLPPVVDPAPTTPLVIKDRVPGALNAINAYRESKGLPKLYLDAQLTISAQMKADDLVEHQYWAHYRDGKTPWDFFDAAGYKYDRAGENLARCFSSSQDIVNAWIKSPAHEAVLTGNYNDAGFGVAHNDVDHCDYVVGHFGTRSGVNS